MWRDKYGTYLEDDVRRGAILNFWIARCLELIALEFVDCRSLTWTIRKTSKAEPQAFSLQNLVKIVHTHNFCCVNNQIFTFLAWKKSATETRKWPRFYLTKIWSKAESVTLNNRQDFAWPLLHAWSNVWKMQLLEVWIWKSLSGRFWQDNHFYSGWS